MFTLDNCSHCISENALINGLLPNLSINTFFSLIPGIIVLLYFFCMLFSYVKSISKELYLIDFKRQDIIRSEETY